MPRNKIVLLPKNKKIKNRRRKIKLASLCRKLITAKVSEHVGVSRSTLSSIENGSSAVSLRIVLQFLLVLGLKKDLLLLAEDDVLGRKLQDANLTVKERGPKNSNE
jgi:transcriptional regulator with XRE-family HTH domain